MNLHRALIVALIPLALACSDEASTLPDGSLGGRLVVSGGASGGIVVNLLGSGVTRTVRTADDGMFRFDALGPGQYFVTPAAPWLEQKTEGTNVFGNDVNLGSVERQAFGQVSGAVSLTNGVDPETVAVVVEGTSWATRVDATGHYTLPWVPAGPQHVRAVARGFLPSRVPVMIARGEMAAASELVLTAGTLDPLPMLEARIDTPTTIRVAIEGTELSSVATPEQQVEIAGAPLGFLELVVQSPFVSGRFPIVVLPGSSGMQLKTVTRQNDIVAHQLEPIEWLKTKMMQPLTETDAELVLLPEKHGTHGLFRRRSPGVWKYSLVPLTQGGTREVTSIEVEASAFQFTPDGSTLFYAAPIEKSAPVALKKVSVATGEVSVFASDMQARAPFLISPDGNTLVYASCCAAGTPTLQAVSLADSTTTTVYTFDGADVSWPENGAAFSADSKAIVFVTGEQLRVASIDGMSGRNLFAAPRGSTFQLTHDSRSVVYATGLNEEVFVADLAGEEAPVGLNVHGAVLAISADDSHVLTIKPGNDVSVTSMQGVSTAGTELIASATLLPDGDNTIRMKSGRLLRSSFAKDQTRRDTFCVQPLPTLVVSRVNDSVPTGDPILFPLPQSFMPIAAGMPEVDYLGNGTVPIFDWTEETRLCSSGFGAFMDLHRTHGRQQEADVSIGLVQPVAFPYLGDETLLFYQWVGEPGFGNHTQWGYMSLPLE